MKRVISNGFSFFETEKGWEADNNQRLGKTGKGKIVRIPPNKKTQKTQEHTKEH